jgi:hypothetical protein
MSVELFFVPVDAAGSVNSCLPAMGKNPSQSATVTIDLQVLTADQRRTEIDRLDLRPASKEFIFLLASHGGVWWSRSREVGPV